MNDWVMFTRDEGLRGPTMSGVVMVAFWVITAAFFLGLFTFAIIGLNSL